MRSVVLVVVIAAICGSSSGLLFDLSNRCTSGLLTCALSSAASMLGSTITNMGSQLAEAGKAVIESAIETGKNILTQTTTGILATVGQSLDKIGKRELVYSRSLSDLLHQAQQFLSASGQSLKDKFVGAVSKLADIAGNLIDIKGDMTTEVNSAVGQFKGDAEAVLNSIRFTLQQIGEKAALKFSELFNQSGSKRGISDAVAIASSALQGALKSVADAMSPHVNTLIKQVTDLGSAITGQAGDLLSKVKQSAEQLKGKLQSHVQTLADHGQTIVQHGKDALGATKDALAQIIGQTLGNAKGTLKDVISIGKDAISVVAEHVGKQGF